MLSALLLLHSSDGFVHSCGDIISDGFLDLAQHGAFDTGGPLCVTVSQWLDVVFVVSFSELIQRLAKVPNLRLGCAIRYKSTK